MCLDKAGGPVSRLRRPSRPRSVRRLPRWLWAPVASITLLAVLVTAMSLGVRVPLLSRLLPFRGLAPFDYGSTPAHDFAPLRDDFVRTAIGELATAVTRNAKDSMSARRPASPVPPNVIDIHPPSNDERQRARSIPRVPYRANTDTRQASRESGESTACGSSDHTVWYRYRPTKAGVLIANTFGSDYSLVLGVFEDAPDRSIRCSTDARGNAIAKFDASPAHTYLFQIGGIAGGGDLVFTLEPEGVLEQVSADHSEDVTLPGTLAFQTSVSADAQTIAFLTNGSEAAPGFPITPCATNVPAPTLGGVWFTNVANPYTTAGVAPSTTPCLQVVVVDRRTGDRRLASVSSSGVPASSNVLEYGLSGDGRFIAFSTSSALVPEDTNGLADIFVRDLVRGRTERVSVSSTGEEMLREDSLGSGDARNPSISHDGRYVFFESSAPNLVPGDRYGTLEANVDVFVRDRLLGTTKRVSVSSEGAPADDAGVALENEIRLREVHTTFARPCISPNGRFVAFVSAASNLASGDRDEATDVFLHDTALNRTELVSILETGRAGIGTPPTYVRNCVSDDGRYVLFGALAVDANGTNATDLFARDRLKARTLPIAEKVDSGTITPNGRYVAYGFNGGDGAHNDIGRNSVYVFDLLWGTSTRLSLHSPGAPDEPDSGTPVLSADGRFVGFDSCPGGVVTAFGAGVAGPVGLPPCSANLYRRGGVA